MTPENHKTPEQMLEVLDDHRRKMKGLLWTGLLTMIVTFSIVCLSGYIALTARSMIGRGVNLLVCCINFSNLNGTLGRLIDTRRVLREISRVRETIELERLARL